MSASHTAHPAARDRRPDARKPARRRSTLFFGGAAVFAVAIVALFVALQAMSGGGSTTVPPRAVSGEGFVLGDPDAPVTVVEYADFQCPVCKRAESTVLARMQEDYIAAGKVKLEFRNLAFQGQESFNAAQAAEAAADQGKFWEYHDALYNAQGAENSGAFSYENLVKIAQQVGLDVPEFEQMLSSNMHLADVQAQADAASAAGISSTPTFFVADTKVVGLQPYATFQDAIDAALRKAQGQ